MLALVCVGVGHPRDAMMRVLVLEAPALFLQLLAISGNRDITNITRNESHHNATNYARTSGARNQLYVTKGERPQA